MRTPTCRSHCRNCGEHFASDEAFDAHRAGSHSADPRSFEGRHCTWPSEGFGSEAGECRVDATPVAANIWHLTPSRSKVRETFTEALDSPQALHASL